MDRVAWEVSSDHFQERVTTMINLETTQAGMLELMYGGKSPDTIYSLRIAALSAMQSLESNGRMARLLSPYVGKLLPERETLTALLQQAHGLVWGCHLDALESIDELWQAGKLDVYMTLPDSYEGQIAWRNGLVKLIRGMSNKTVSMAALLMSPLTVELIPLDRHHYRRLGFSADYQARGKKYIALEMQIRAEKCNAGYSGIPTGLYAAFLWAVQRNGIDTDVYPSHKALSCRWY
jgi:hypothetical protein